MMIITKKLQFGDFKKVHIFFVASNHKKIPDFSKVSESFQRLTVGCWGSNIARGFINWFIKIMEPFYEWSLIDQGPENVSEKRKL